MDPTPTSPGNSAPTLEREAPAAGRSGTGLRLAIGGAIAVLAAGLAFVVVGQGGGTGEGADSPEAAIEALVEAIEASDLEAAMATVVPGERDVLDDSMREILSELGRIELLANDIDLTAIPGIDLEVIDLSLTATSTSDDLALVDIGGTLRATIFGADLPLGPAFADQDALPPDASVADLPSPPPTGLDLTLATQRIDGRWFVSFGHTIGELWRTGNGLPSPDPGSTPAAQGFDSPDALAEAFAAALDPIDPAAIVAMLNPGEASAAHRQAPNLMPVRNWAASSEGYTIDELRYHIDQQGDRADVVVDVLAVTNVYEDSWNHATYYSTVRFEDGCVNVRDPSTESRNEELEYYVIPGMTFEEDGSITTCPHEDPPGGGLGILGFLGGGIYGGSYSPPTLGLVRHDGQWYVSPVRTVANQILDSLREIPNGGGVDLLRGTLMPYQSTSAESFATAGEIYPEDPGVTATTIEMTFETTMNSQEG